MWRSGMIGVVLAVAVLTITGEWWAGVMGGIVCTVVILTLQAGAIVVPAFQAAVILNRLNLYTGMRKSGLRFILPFWHHVGYYVNLASKKADIKVPGLYTRDRVRVAISLSIFYRLDPWRVPVERRPELIGVLEPSAGSVLQGQVEHLLHRLIGQQDMTTLLQPETRTHVENCLLRELPRRLDGLGLAISGPIMLGSIELPEAVQAEINRAEQIRIQTSARADALNVLREAFGAQPDRAWEQVMEFEAIGALAQQSLPTYALLNSQSKNGKH
jgi:regulator of protease activity HflC (stomatin/prohibitin superfamily)